MVLKENNKAISENMDNIKAIITLDPCLVLSFKDINTVMVQTDISNFYIRVILQ
jgi:hypothetical protein